MSCNSAVTVGKMHGGQTGDTGLKEYQGKKQRGFICKTLKTFLKKGEFIV